MPRELRVSITLKDNEHRIHLEGEPGELHELALLTRGALTVWNIHQASGKEETYRSVINAWRGSSTTSSAAAKAHGKLGEALNRHRKQHPACTLADA